MGKVLLFLVLLVVAAVGTMVVASEMGGELVSVKTNDAQGAQRTTSLWIVDAPSGSYLRAGSQGSGWYERMVVDPNIEVERNGENGRYVAEPAPERTADIEALMAEKYGWADRVVTLMPGRDPIAIRIVPAE